MKVTIDTDTISKKEAIKKIEEAYNTGLCKCYYEKQIDARLTEYEKGYYAGIGVKLPLYEIETRCSGTQEQDICNCGGDRKKCTFYPDNRK